MFLKESTILSWTAAGAFVAMLSACGSDGTGGQNAPPRRAEDASDETFALESGTYYIDRVWDLSDGCGREPLNPQDPITATSFTLTNGGDGKVTLDRCLYDGTSTTGDVLDNKGVLTARHPGRKDVYGDLTAIYDQECRMEVKLTANNQLEAAFSERQAGRNQAMREASVDTDTCTTSYKVTMSKRS